jgi:hypothetical protein
MLEHGEMPLPGELVQIGMVLGRDSARARAAEAANGRHQVGNAPLLYVVAPQIAIETGTGAPFGSWVWHHRVKLCAEPEEAFIRIQNPGMADHDVMAAAGRERAERAYVDPACAPKDCAREACGAMFRGPALYCSLKCAEADA